MIGSTLITVKGGVNVQLNLGDIVRLRKSHPCGGTDWEIMRTGMDFRIKCLRCQHQTWITRIKLERQIKQIVKQNQPQSE